MKEHRELEFKESITNTFLKTVSAFANYRSGKIIFGISDDGRYVGIENTKQACLDIENKINDAIKPLPKYTIDIDDNTKLITLIVEKGKDTPYLYKGKAYIRNDSSTIEVGQIELKRLTMQGMNTTFDRIPSYEQELSFHILEEECQKKLGIEQLTRDNLITLGLLDKSIGYTNAGALLADVNEFYGIDIARFGATIDIILNCYTFARQSILKTYQEAVRVYRENYQYDEIQGIERVVVETIPEKAFREAIANALIHRTWDVSAHIRVAMYDDRIEITSPGGLLDQLSKEDYLYKEVSMLRNPVIGNVFFRLQLIEQFGTGVQRIIASYKHCKRQPVFDISENFIKIILPVVIQDTIRMSPSAQRIYEVLQDGELSSSELAKLTGYGKRIILESVKELIVGGYVIKIGSGPKTKYTVTYTI